MGNIGSSSLKRIYVGDAKIKQGYLGAERVYASGNIVTYNVDSSVMYAEEVDCDATCLAPTSFTPAKSGYTFVGWREDNSAAGSVLTEKAMGDEPITLYAVFRKTITLTLYNGASTATKKTGYQYYNNGNITNPAFTVAQTALSGWTTRGWSKGTTGNGSIAYSSLNNTTFAVDTTLYGMYQQTITITYYNNSTTASTTTGVRYYNSNGNAVNPSFTLTQATKSGWTARGWTTGTAGNATVSYSNATAFSIAGNITLYGLYQQTITLTTVANGVTSKANGVRYYNSNGNIVNPTFIVANPTRSGMTFQGWSSSASSTTITNSSINGLELSASTTRYATFKYADVVLATKTGYWYGYLNESDYLEIDASKYSAVTLAGWSHMRAGSTAATTSGTAYLYLGSQKIVTVTHGTGYQYGNGYNYDIDGTYSITSTSGTIKLYCSGSPVGQGLVVESGTATITGVGRTIVG